MASSVYQPLCHLDSFRVLILEAGKDDDPIRCHLRAIRLTDKIMYEAISYTWGDASYLHSIALEESDFKVRKNLYSILRRFRNEREPRTLWTDAICINQKDILERNQQVSMMKFIYENSKETLVWLGEPEKSDEIALHIFAHVEVASLAPLLSPPERMTVLSATLLNRDSSTGYSGSEKQKSMLALFSKPWFRRVWVIQEFTVSTHARVICGTHSFSTETLIVIVQTLFDSPLSTVSLYNVLLGVRPFVAIRGDQQSQHPSSLSDMLNYTLGKYEASEPKDHIFALLGLADDRTRQELVVDYNLTAPQIFTNTTAYCIKSAKDPFRLLAKVATFPNGELRIALPSWVPDFSSKITFFRLFSYFQIFSTAVDSTHKISVKGKILTLSGKVIDTIITCLQCPPPERLIGRTWFDWYERCRRHAKEKWRNYNQESFSDAWWRLMVCDTHLSSREGKETFEPASKGYGQYYLKNELSAPCLDQDSRYSNDPELGRAQAQYGYTSNATSAGMNFCSTETGRLGWVPQSTRVGDKICIFAGCSAPWIVRDRNCGYYGLVGEGYIHGIMYGEAMNWEEGEWDALQFE